MFFILLGFNACDNIIQKQIFLLLLLMDKANVENIGNLIAHPDLLLWRIDKLRYHESYPIFFFPLPKIFAKKKDIFL